MKLSAIIVALAALLIAVPVDADFARDLVNAAGIEGGLIVQIGCDDAILTAALRVDERYIVHGLDPSAATVELARETIRSLGIYGDVAIDRLTGDRLPYADNLVNLVVSEDLGSVTLDEVLRVLVPDGVAYIYSGGSWNMTVKPRPSNIDEWTHFLHGADNNAVADDDLVGPPRRMQWVANPLWLRSHETPSGVSAVVSTGGRIFYVLDEGVIGITDERLPDTWSLIARDAFNGVFLWKQPLDNWGWSEWDYDTYAGKDWTVDYPKRTSSPTTVRRRLVAVGDRVYMTLGHWAPLSILDAATGEVIQTIEESLGTDEVLYSDGILLLSIKNLDSETAERRGETVTQRLMAAAADTGQVLWEQTVNLTTLTLAAGEGKVFYRIGAGVVCLDINTGEELWRNTDDTTKVITLVYHDGIVLAHDADKLRAISAATGEGLWTYLKDADGSAPKNDLFVANGRIWRGIKGVGLNLLTGAEEVQLSTTNLRSEPHHHRCFRGKATHNYLLSAKEGIELLDLNGIGETNKNSRNNWVRGVCNYGIMPCNGFIYSPPDQCFCEPGVKLLGFNALAAEDESAPPEPGSDDPARFETGLAFGNIPSPGAAYPADWPSYRHDAARSGSTTSVMPANVECLWKVPIAGKLSAPVAADGMVFVAAVNEHTVYALDEADGTVLWRYTAGGRVDSPPTVYDGMALFGSADGWVYCLRASDGELAWRFRAAPVERRIGGFGQVESAWPVHGSVLVQNGVVYCSAGRSSFLDGGVRVYGLDPATGAVLYETILEGPYEDLSEGSGQTFYLDGLRNDILTGDGNRIYLGQAQLDNSLVKLDSPWITGKGDRVMGQHLFATGGFLDGSEYNRAFWMHSARWPGFYIANQAPKSGRLVVFDDSRAYAVKGYTRRNRHSPMYFPGTDGYLLYSDDLSNEPQLVDTNGVPVPVEWLPQSSYMASDGLRELTDQAVDKDKGIGFTRSQPPVWTTWLQSRVRAMAKAGDTIFTAGPPDILPPADPLVAFEGRAGAMLCSVSASDGSPLSTLPLDAPPVFDGLIAANGKLFLTLEDGSVRCFRGRDPVSVFKDRRHRMSFTFPGYDRSETLANFPVLIKLSEDLPGFDYSQFQDPVGGGDLRFTDATMTNALSYEIESWDPAGESLVWVKVPDFRGAGTRIWAYWGHADTTPPSYTTDGTTWSEGFEAVWHLSETELSVRADATANENDSHPRNYEGDEGSLNGVFGGADLLDGNDDCLAITNLYYDSTNQIPEIMVSAWVKSANTAEQMIVSFDRNEYWRLALKDDGGSHNLNWGTRGSNSTHNLRTATDYADGAWHYICGIYKADETPSKLLFVDGVAVTNAAAHGGEGLGKGTVRYGFLGVGSEASVFNGDTGPNIFFSGLLDEVRIDNAARSPDWIWACYAMAASNTTFCENSSVETVEPVTSMGTSHAWLDAYGLAGSGYENADWSDTDGDGQYAWAEARCGTDPTDPASFFRIISIDSDHNLKWITGTNNVNTPVSIFRKPDLTTPSSWGTPYTIRPRVHGTNTWWDADAMHHPAMFYYLSIPSP